MTAWYQVNCCASYLGVVYQCFQVLLVCDFLAKWGRGEGTTLLGRIDHLTVVLALWI